MRGVKTEGGEKVPQDGLQGKAHAVLQAVNMDGSEAFGWTTRDLRPLWHAKLRIEQGAKLAPKPRNLAGSDGARHVEAGKTVWLRRARDDTRTRPSPFLGRGDRIHG